MFPVQYFNRRLYEQVFSRLRYTHFIQTGNASVVNMTCGQNGCRESFTSISAFRSHLKVCVQLAEGVNTGLNVPNCVPFSYSCNSPQTDCYQNSQPTPDPIVQTPLPSPCSLTVSVGRIMLELRAKHNVSHAALNYLTKGLHDAFKDLNECEVDNLSSPATVFESFDSQFKRKRI